MPSGVHNCRYLYQKGTWPYLVTVQLDEWNEFCVNKEKTLLLDKL